LISDIACQLFFNSPEDSNFFKNTLSLAIGKDLPLLVDLVPILGNLFPKEDVPRQKIDIGPSEAEDRILRLVRKFATCVAISERPLVLFIDDLQWSSEAEFSALAGLISSFASAGSSSAIRNCFMIICHRANELSSATAQKLKESFDKLELKNTLGESHALLEIQVGPLPMVYRCPHRFNLRATLKTS
jgi:predicted ATPase